MYRTNAYVEPPPSPPIQETKPVVQKVRAVKAPRPPMHYKDREMLVEALMLVTWVFLGGAFIWWDAEARDLRVPTWKYPHHIRGVKQCNSKT